MASATKVTSITSCRRHWGKLSSMGKSPSLAKPSSRVTSLMNSASSAFLAQLLYAFMRSTTTLSFFLFSWMLLATSTPTASSLSESAFNKFAQFLKKAWGPESSPSHRTSESHSNL